MSVRGADDIPWKENTPEARAALVNAPEPYSGLTFQTYPGVVPPELLAYVAALTESDRSLVLWGAQGVGKTALGIAVLRALAFAGDGSVFQWNVLTRPDQLPLGRGERPDPSPVWFERWSNLLALNRRQDWDEVGWFDQLDDVTALMLDDVGAETGTQYRQGLLLRHLEWAEDRRGRRLVLTLNDLPEKWSTTLGERAADRLQEARRFQVVHVPGGSLR